MVVNFSIYLHKINKQQTMELWRIRFVFLMLLLLYFHGQTNTNVFIGDISLPHQVLQKLKAELHISYLLHRFITAFRGYKIEQLKKSGLLAPKCRKHGFTKLANLIFQILAVNPIYAIDIQVEVIAHLLYIWGLHF